VARKLSQSPFKQRKRITTPGPSFPSAKNTQNTLIKVEKLCEVGVLRQQQASKEALPSFKVPNENKPYAL
jgi:hypothetical protein